MSMKESAAGVEIGPAVVALRHPVARHRRGERLERLVDREADVVGGEAQPTESVEERAGGREADLVAGLTGGEGERDQRVDVPVRRPGAEQDLHGRVLGGRVGGAGGSHRRVDPSGDPAMVGGAGP